MKITTVPRSQCIRRKDEPHMSRLILDKYLLDAVTHFGVERDYPIVNNVMDYIEQQRKDFFEGV